MAQFSGEIKIKRHVYEQNEVNIFKLVFRANLSFTIHKIQ